MAALPPSYDEAISRDPWPAILRYTDRHTLCVTSRVCTKWYKISVRYLWGDPAANFDDHDSAILGLVEFLGSLHTARLELRKLTHSLKFPWAHVEAYGGLGDDWLRKTLDLLPNLKSLHVRRLSFFEQSALIKLRYAGNSGLTRSQPPTFGLRYLDASGCVYLSADSLYRALPQFPHLVVLNLSSVYPASERLGSVSPLHALMHLPDLRVLKLCKTGLRNVHVEILASTLQHRLKYLDVRDNQLTDKACETFIDHFMSMPSDELEPPPWLFDPEYSLFEDSDENLDKRLERLLSKPTFDMAVLDQVASPTISHLQISGNTHITPSMLVTMLHKGMLTSLDATVPPIPKNILFDPTTLAVEDTKLRYLRVHWSFLLLSRDMFTNLRALRILALTNIPQKAKDTTLVDTLSTLLSSAGRHASTQRENIRKSNAVPPGRRTLAGLKAQTLVQFPLRKIILEIQQGNHYLGPTTTDESKHHTKQPNESLSTTGDTDSEIFYAASKDDFSFFKDEEREEEGIYLTNRDLLRATGKQFDAQHRPPSSSSAAREGIYVIDTIEKIAAMRKCQRAEYEAREARFVFSDAVDHEWEPKLYWDGEVVVLRK